MSDGKQYPPVIKFNPGQPQVLTIKKEFAVSKNGSHCWEVYQDGIKKTLFATEALNQRIVKFNPDTELSIAILGSGETAKWEVSPTVFSNDGRQSSEPVNSTDPTERKNLRERRIDLYLEALTDAREVAANYHQVNGGELPVECVQAIATTFFIEWNKKGLK